MIKNDKQYQVTKNKLKEFKEAFIGQGQQEMDPLLKELAEGSIKSQIEDFEKQIEEYDALKSGNISYLLVESIDLLPEALIKGRIAKGWTHSDLANVLELKEQQIQRYEASNYSTASLSRLIQVADKLNLNFSQIKIKVSEPRFMIPDGINKDELYAEQRRIHEKKSLIAV